MASRFDIIGDIHGCADQLEELLSALGYVERDGAYRHEDRTALFVGDFIDRGPQQKRTIEIVRPMAEGSNNICCVGDDDQSIYARRGAYVDKVLRFEKDFPGAKVISLEQNYRSTAHILAAASPVIAQNTSRLGKTLRTDAGEGDLVKVRGFSNGEQSPETC